MQIKRYMQRFFLIGMEVKNAIYADSILFAELMPIYFGLKLRDVYQDERTLIQQLPTSYRNVI